MTIRLPLAAALAITASLIVAPIAAAPQPAAALTSSQATDAFEDFLSVYWDDSANYFFAYSDHQIHPEHAHGPQGGLYTDYWWEAQLWEMVMDRYERTGDAQSRELIDDVYTGFQSQYPDYSDNDWNDDIGWWARGAIRAYELTGDTAYLTASQTMFASISAYEDTVYGGGIWWKNVDVGNGAQNEKNVATNATAVYTAMRLYAATGDRAYRTTAHRIYAWLNANFNQNGHLRDHVSGTGQYTDWDWTYNQGNFAGAALELALDSTGSTAAGYLADATTAVDWAIDKLTSSGTFLHEGLDDTGGFKAILTRNMRALIDQGGQTQYESVLVQNASQAANHVNESGIGGYDWNAPTPALSSTAIQSLAAAATVAVLQQAMPDGTTGIIQGSGTYEAENAIRSGINTESTSSGYSGRGYLAGWNAAGTSVTFTVNVATSRVYVLDLRYSAAAGQAKRSLIVNGATAQLTFPATAAWNAWSNAAASVPLVAGSNTITISFSAPSSVNFLNLDRLMIGL